MSERLTPQEFEEERKRNSLYSSFGHLADRMLESATQHTPVWKRAHYVLPNTEKEQFLEDLGQSSLNTLLKTQTNNTESIPRPHAISLSVEEYDYSEFPSGYAAISLQREFQLHLHYNKDDIRLKLAVDYQTVGSYSFSDNLAETGYEGHNFITKTPNLQELQDYYSLARHFDPTYQTDEKPLEEHFGNIVNIDPETGKKLFYNPGIKDWEIPLDDRSPEDEIEMKKSNKQYLIKYIDNES